MPIVDAANDYLSSLNREWIVAADRCRGIHSTFQLFTNDQPPILSRQPDKELTPKPHEANRYDMQLRVLGLVRAVSHTLTFYSKKTLNSEKTGSLESLEMELLVKFQQLCEQAQFATGNSQLHQLEDQFHNTLFDTLDKASLADDVTNEHDAAKLLQHYRNLSGLLDQPATLITTLVDDQVEGEPVTHIEKTISITEKTEKQKEALREKNYKNSNTYKKQHEAFGTKAENAMKKATDAFIQFLGDDTRRLPAELDYITEHSLKNGNIFFYEIQRKGKVLAKKYAIRHGAIPYFALPNLDIDKNAADQNVSQLHNAISKFDDTCDKDIQTVILNTDTYLGNQHIMVKRTEEAVGKEHVSLMSINPQGVLKRSKLSTKLNKAKFPEHSRFRHNERFSKLSQVLQHLIADESKIPAIACQHTLDRSGTATVLMWLNFSQKVYEDKEITLKQNQNSREQNSSPIFKYLESLHARGGHAAMIRMLNYPGAYGMHPDSIPNPLWLYKVLGSSDIFSKDTVKALYRHDVNRVKKIKLANDPFIGLFTAIDPIEFLDKLINSSAEDPVQENDKNKKIINTYRKQCDDQKQLTHITEIKYTDNNQDQIKSISHVDVRTGIKHIMTYDQKINKYSFKSGNITTLSEKQLFQSDKTAIIDEAVLLLLKLVEKKQLKLKKNSKELNLKNEFRKYFEHRDYKIETINEVLAKGFKEHFDFPSGNTGNTSISNFLLDIETDATNVCAFNKDKPELITNINFMDFAIDNMNVKANEKIKSFKSVREKKFPNDVGLDENIYNNYKKLLLNLQNDLDASSNESHAKTQLNKIPGKLSGVTQVLWWIGLTKNKQEIQDHYKNKHDLVAGIVNQLSHNPKQLTRRGMINLVKEHTSQLKSNKQFSRGLYAGSIFGKQSRAVKELEKIEKQILSKINPAA